MSQKMNEDDSEDVKKSKILFAIQEIQNRYDRYISIKTFETTIKYIDSVFGSAFLLGNYMSGEEIKNIKNLLKFKDSIYEMILDRLIDVKKELEKHVMNLSDKEISNKYNTIIQQTESILNQIDDDYNNTRLGNKTYKIDKNGKLIRVSDIEICLSLMYE